MKYTFISTDGSKNQVVEIASEHLTLTADGFETLFFDKARTSTTFMEAYEKVEVWHEETFGKRKYSDYNSFQTTKSRRYKHDSRKDSF